jgi:hypothetical protein
MFAVASTQATTIDFDGTGAPIDFLDTTALRDLYSGSGVHFLGSTGAKDGGAILNQGSNFGVGALSGTDFLAFNSSASLSDGGIPQLNEIINFDVNQGFVSIFLSGGPKVETMRLEAFAGLDGTGSPLGFDQFDAPNSAWSEFAVTATGIGSVVISSPNTGLFVADNLSFSTTVPSEVPDTSGVPEPSSVWLISAGLVAIAAFRRRIQNLL